MICGSGTILIVDDEPAIGRVLKACLEQVGYSVLVAHDGEAALNLYEEHQANIRLLLTDVRMPNMNGLELADRVLQREPQARVLFMSATQFTASRGFGCVAKPFHVVELIERIGEVLVMTATPDGTRTN